MKHSETNWTLDRNTITVFIPMIWKRRGGQKVIIAPDGGDAWVPARPFSRPLPPLSSTPCRRTTLPRDSGFVQ